MERFLRNTKRAKGVECLQRSKAIMLLVLFYLLTLPAVSYAQSDSELLFDCSMSFRGAQDFDKTGRVHHAFTERVTVSQNQNLYDIQLIFGDWVFRGAGGVNVYFAINHYVDEENNRSPVLSAGLYMMSKGARRALHSGDKAVYTVENQYGGIEPVEPHFKFKSSGARQTIEFTIDEYVRVEEHQTPYTVDFYCEAVEGAINE